MEERRRSFRRKADRDLFEWVQQHKGEIDAREMRHEKRRVIRHNCKVSIEMLLRMSSGRSNDWSVDSIALKGRLLDLSPGGAALMTRERFETGQELRLAIQLPNSSMVNAVAIIRWTKEVPESGAYASGVQFKSVADKDQHRITEFLESIERS